MNGKKVYQDLIMVISGSFLIAIGINMFFLKNHIVAGGMNGLSIVVNYLTGIEPSLMLLVTNIPLLLISYLFLGKSYTIKTVFGALILPAMVFLTQGFPTVTDQPLLAALFGGLVTGAGLGVVFKANASTGGTAIISQIVHKYAKIPLGIAVGLVDGLVILSAFITFTPETVMYSLITLFVISRMIDKIQLGFNRSKNVLIISSQAVEIEKAILTKLDQGLTLIPVKGAYNKKEEAMLMCVVPEKKFPRLKEHVLSIDTQAFVVVMSANEVMGLGFSLPTE